MWVLHEVFFCLLSTAVHGVIVVLLLFASVSEIASSVLTKPRVLFGGWKPILPGHPFYFGPVGYKRSLLHPEGEDNGPRIVDPEYRIVDSSLPHQPKIYSSEFPDEQKSTKPDNNIFDYYPRDSEPDHTTQPFLHRPLYIELPRKPLDVFEKPTIGVTKDLGYVNHDDQLANHPLLQEKVYLKITPLEDNEDHQKKPNIGYGHYVPLASRQPTLDSVISQSPQLSHLMRNHQYQQQIIPPQAVTLPSYENSLHLQIHQKPLSRPRILPVLSKGITQGLPEVSHNTLGGPNLVTVPDLDLQTQGLQGIPPRSLIRHGLSVPHRYLSPHNLDISHKSILSSEFGSVEAHRTIPSPPRGQMHSGHVRNQFPSIPDGQFNPHSLRQSLPNLEVPPEFVLLQSHLRSQQQHGQRNLFPQLHPKIPHISAYPGPGGLHNQQQPPIPDGRYNSGHSPHVFFKPDVHHNRNLPRNHNPVRHLPTKEAINDFRINPSIQSVHDSHAYQERPHVEPDRPTVFIHSNSHGDSTSYGSETNVQSMREEDQMPHRNPEEELSVHALNGPSYHQTYESSTKDYRDQENNLVLHQPDSVHDYYSTTETNYVRAETLNDDSDEERGFKGSYADGSFKGSYADSGFKGSHADSGFKGSHSDGGFKESYSESDFKGSHADTGFKGSHADTGFKRSHADSGFKGSHADSGFKGSHSDGGFKESYSESDFKGSHADSGFKGSYSESDFKGSHADSGFKGGYTDSGFKGSYADSGFKGNYGESDFKGMHQPTYLIQNSTFVIDHEVNDSFKPNSKIRLKDDRDYADITVSNIGYLTGSRLESAYDGGKGPLMHVANTPYSTTLSRNEQNPKNFIKHNKEGRFSFQNESSSHKNEANSNTKIANDEKLYYNSRENALVEEISNFQKKSTSKDDSKRNDRDGSTGNTKDLRYQDSISLNESVNVTNADAQSPQMFHAYYASADHEPPEGYVRMSLDEFNKHFGNAEIHYVDDGQHASKKITAAA